MMKLKNTVENLADMVYPSDIVYCVSTSFCTSRFLLSANTSLND